MVSVSFIKLVFSFGIIVNEPDVIDEALDYFRPHMFCRQFKPKGGADRVMIYCYLYMIECCKQLHGVCCFTCYSFNFEL